MISTRLPLSLLVVCGCLCAQQDRYQPRVPAQDVQALNTARQQMKAGRSQEAAATLEALTKRNPHYFLAQYNYGIALGNLDDYTGSLQALKKALSLREVEKLDEWTIYNSTGWGYMLVGDIRNAEATLLQAEKIADKLTPDSRGKLWNNLGYLYLSKGDKSRAKPYLERSRDLGNRIAVSNLRLLESLQKAGVSKQ